MRRSWLGANRPDGEFREKTTDGCMLPRGTSNLLVTGRIISTTHEAFASSRTAAICFALAHGAGLARGNGANGRLAPGRKLRAANAGILGACHGAGMKRLQLDLILPDESKKASSQPFSGQLLAFFVHGIQAYQSIGSSLCSRGHTAPVDGAPATCWTGSAGSRALSNRSSRRCGRI